jgi:GDP-L-fucose synthase
VRVYVPGSRGLVGSSVIRNSPREVDIIETTRDQLDLHDYLALVDFLADQKVDSIIFCAAKVGGISANSRYQMSFLLDNLKIQNAVMEAACKLRIANLVFLGSSCIYPRLAKQPISETSLLTGELEPTNEGYALAKIAGVRLAKAIHDEQGLNFFSLMPTNMYGPNDNFDLESSHVPAALMRKFHEAKVNRAPQVVIWGTGNPRREFMHVDDMAKACWYLLDKKVGGELINIGTGEDLPISEFARMMAKVVGYEGEIVYDSSKPDGTPRKLLDVSKAHSYGWRHEIELEEGLSQTYAWFVEALEKGAVRGY